MSILVGSQGSVIASTMTSKDTQVQIFPMPKVCIFSEEKKGEIWENARANPLVVLISLLDVCVPTLNTILEIIDKKNRSKLS